MVEVLTVNLPLEIHKKAKEMQNSETFTKSESLDEVISPVSRHGSPRWFRLPCVSRTWLSRHVPISSPAIKTGVMSPALRSDNVCSNSDKLYKLRRLRHGLKCHFLPKFVAPTLYGVVRSVKVFWKFLSTSTETDSGKILGCGCNVMIRYRWWFLIKLCPLKIEQ